MNIFQMFSSTPEPPNVNILSKNTASENLQEFGWELGHLH